MFNPMANTIIIVCDAPAGPGPYTQRAHCGTTQPLTAVKKCTCPEGIGQSPDLHFLLCPLHDPLTCYTCKKEVGRE